MLTVDPQACLADGKPDDEPLSQSPITSSTLSVATVAGTGMRIEMSQPREFVVAGVVRSLRP